MGDVRFRLSISLVAINIKSQESGIKSQKQAKKVKRRRFSALISSNLTKPHM